MSDGIPLPPFIWKLLFETEYRCECGWVGTWKDSAGVDKDGVICLLCHKRADDGSDIPVVVQNKESANV